MTNLLLDITFDTSKLLKNAIDYVLISYVLQTFVFVINFYHSILMKYAYVHILINQGPG